MLEQGAETGHSINVGDEVRQPDRRHGCCHSFCECECGFGLGGFDSGNSKSLCANARVAPAGLQPARCFAQFLVQRFGF